ncbi:helix-turn-helix domain-containing protein [Actinomadura fibrosa]|uniref:Helix-turn-helix domain-containing protein n=1 Tax=Actinomadura fibrosa TaxID=111802 RepID=A0ABW2XSK7_9ACTN|nr:helix-turn-helix transcriptional regulator [Actinomadura fibrosa]
MTNPASTVRLRKIGRVLHDLREESGLTLKAASRRLERSTTSLCLIEKGNQWLRFRDLEYILDRYKAPPDVRDALMTLARQHKQTGWWDAYKDVISHDARDFASVEWDSADIISTQTAVIPGFLQTADYARTVLRADPQAPQPDRAERLVEFRLARQQILLRDPPTSLHVIIDEAALRRMRGGRTVMRSQVRRLIQECDQEHVNLQVLPFAVDPGPAYTGQFQLLDIGRPPILSLVLIDEITSRLVREEPAEITRYRSVYNYAKEVALTKEDSRELMLEILSEL